MSWQKASKANNVIIRDSVVNISKDNSTWQTVYGTTAFSNGTHAFKIKVDEMASSIVIGIASELHAVYFHNTQNQYGWHCPNGQIVNETNWVSYQNKTKFIKGDIVTTHLDLDQRKLGYSKNGVFIGNAVENLKALDYRLAVSIHSGPSQITLLNVDEKKEENKVEMKDEYYIKHSMQYIGKQLNMLNTKYSSEEIDNCSYKNLLKKLEYLNQIEADMNELDIEYEKCKQQLLRSKQILSEKMIADTSQYKSWKLEEIEIWLHGLENGRYKIYIAKLLQEFKKDGINGSHLSTLDKK